MITANVYAETPKAFPFNACMKVWGHGNPTLIKLPAPTSGFAGLTIKLELSKCEHQKKLKGLIVMVTSDNNDGTLDTVCQMINYNDPNQKDQHECTFTVPAGSGPRDLSMTVTRYGKGGSSKVQVTATQIKP
jgi:hypothetical protein